MKKLVIFITAILLAFTVGCNGGSNNSKSAKKDISNPTMAAGIETTTAAGTTVSGQSTTNAITTSSRVINGTTAKPASGRRINANPIDVGGTYDNPTDETPSGDTSSTTQAPYSKETPIAKNALGYDKVNIGDSVVSPLTKSTYKLKFIDNFSGTTINSSNWTVDTGNYNTAEEQANLPENVVVKDNRLNIYGKKDTVKHNRTARWGEAESASYYTGGAINSEKKQSFQFGRIEMLAKLPYSQGMWPAFWSMGTKRGWPWGGEIDIMEMVGGDDQWGNKNRDGQYNSTLHWCDPDAADPYGKDHKSVGHTYNLPNQSSGGKLYDAWHVIGFEWTNTKIMFYIDNIKHTEYSITDTTQRESFFQPHWMILNLAMGGGWATSPDSYGPTAWPQNYQIDWVKVWQK